jgi:hypothetical protein
MARSYGHLVDNFDEKTGTSRPYEPATDKLKLDTIETMRDAGEALEMCFEMIRYLSGGRRRMVEVAEEKYYSQINPSDHATPPPIERIWFEQTGVRVRTFPVGPTPVEIEMMAMALFGGGGSFYEKTQPGTRQIYRRMARENLDMAYREGDGTSMGSASDKDLNPSLRTEEPGIRDGWF